MLPPAVVSAMCMRNSLRLLDLCMDIDLRRYWLPLKIEVAKAMALFSRRHPDILISTVGVWGDAFHGTATLHLDSAVHSAAHIQKYSDAAREDIDGRFSAACRDFAFQIAELRFPDYPDLYNHSRETELAFISLNGDRGIVDFARGDAGKDLHVLPFLRRLISSFEPFPQLSRAWPLRCCVEMHGSGDVECWRVKLDEHSHISE